MSDVPRINYIAHSNTTAESELQTLAAIYAFILECHAKRNADKSNANEKAETMSCLNQERRSSCDVDD